MNEKNDKINNVLLIFSKLIRQTALFLLKHRAMPQPTMQIQLHSIDYLVPLLLCKSGQVWTSLDKSGQVWTS